MGASEARAVFLKVINCEGEHKDKFFISNLVSQAIEEVGHQNVIQVITDNASVCSATGLLIESKYPNIFWTPCVVHTLNLALKNICAPKETRGTAFAYGEYHWITLCVDDAMFIKNFIMNHSMQLVVFNKFIPLKLLVVVDTRFASAIIMLKRFCDSDKPCLHLVYEMWDTMIEKVKASIFRHEGKLDHEESIFYSVVHNVLVKRWAKSNTPLHYLAHSSNPRYYSSTWLNENPNRVPSHRDEEISSMRNKCSKKYFPNLEERRVVNVEYAKFSGGLDMFGDFDSKIDRGVLDPLIWWLTHGFPAPMLQSLALKLLGQPCSSSCCERN
ncbi:uncharacterized protein LOC114300304 [Camellia sinensis]|uniref:uncharacterized protein LOC114300304 n=1 Tax=Camellia sinensis TaxID=4442 RepID=UPI001036DBF9|nr:uncharacterized protein LOC114300304 [Camellia sinensis]